MNFIKHCKEKINNYKERRAEKKRIYDQNHWIEIDPPEWIQKAARKWIMIGCDPDEIDHPELYKRRAPTGFVDHSKILTMKYFYGNTFIYKVWFYTSDKIYCWRRLRWDR